MAYLSGCEAPMKGRRMRHEWTRALSRFALLWHHSGGKKRFDVTAERWPGLHSWILGVISLREKANCVD